MNEYESKVSISIDKDIALVLFDWLARFNEGSCDTVDKVEGKTLYMLEATLEEILVEPFMENYKEIIANTKERIRQSME